MVHHAGKMLLHREWGGEKIHSERCKGRHHNSYCDLTMIIPYRSINCLIHFIFHGIAYTNNCSLFQGSKTSTPPTATAQMFIAPLKTQEEIQGLAQQVKVLVMNIWQPELDLPNACDGG